MNIKFYENFEVALAKLEQFVEQGIKDELDRAGLIQGFEFTYEKCWKAIQKKANAEGLNIGSPKQAFSTALDWDWIDKSKEETWLGMITDRNQTTHTYREETAKNVTAHILEKYVPAFQSIIQKMKTAHED